MAQPPANILTAHPSNPKRLKLGDNVRLTRDIENDRYLEGIVFQVVLVWLMEGYAADDFVTVCLRVVDGPQRGDVTLDAASTAIARL